MAKVSGPLFSETASGNLAKGALQYRSGHWGTQVYKPLTPLKQNQGQPSPAQTARRELFNVVKDNWHALSAEAKKTYQDQAKALGTMNGWNLYVSIGLKNLAYPVNYLLGSDGQPILDNAGSILEID
ncbi:MAG: hypothetical protein RIQ94_383 [Pseudomonadota bacterium]